MAKRSAPESVVAREAKALLAGKGPAWMSGSARLLSELQRRRAARTTEAWDALRRVAFHAHGLLAGMAGRPGRTKFTVSAQVFARLAAALGDARKAGVDLDQVGPGPFLNR